ncbi:MAG: hypothetical protein H7Z43_15605, partial [Clostridia bacterium]|nr:hypothetical protein [Deltaproteobacteria bacterium]
RLIPALDVNRAKAIDAINIALPSLVNNIHTDASPVVLVDQASGFDPAELTFDGVHPNTAGEDRMAAVWFDAITDLGTQD